MKSFEGPSTPSKRGGISTETPSLRIASFPVPSGANPYVQLYCDAAKLAGIEFLEETRYDLRWLDENASRIDAIHLHWPEFLWRQYPNWYRRLTSYPGVWRLRRLFGPMLRHPAYRRFRHFVSRAKEHGIIVAWTLHNIEPHENPKALDAKASKMLAGQADLIVCHSQSAMDKCRELWHPDGTVLLMPHGNYDGVYPPPRPRDDVLNALELDPAKPMVCCVGLIRQYKGIDRAVEAVRQLKGEVQLVIAGARHRDFDTAPLVRETADLPYVRWKLERISDQEFADIVGASEAVLLPYQKITGSGALLSALTLERGVVASDLPYFREILGEADDAGRLAVVNEGSTVLAEAIRDYLSVPAEQRREAARSVADKYAWRQVVQPVVNALEKMRSEGT